MDKPHAEPDENSDSEACINESKMLSTNLDAMGYNDITRHKTKELFLSFDECHSIFERALNDKSPRCKFTVGSQIECTVLSDSDADFLFAPTTEHVAAIESLNDERDGRVNIIVVRNEMSPPGHVRLRYISQTQPIPVTKSSMLKVEICHRLELQLILYARTYQPWLEVPDVDKHLLREWLGTLFIDDKGMHFYIPNSLFTLIGKHNFGNKASRNGPSFSCNKTDIVRPIFCDNIFPRNQDPSTIGGKLYGNLNVPNEYCCNLVPFGHPESEDSILEWRISYNLTEREIMFGLNITHFQTYVILKMLQRSYFKPLVKEGFTSYHCKTALFYTISITAPTIWREDNLINCVRQCLKMIRIFLKKRFCPHFFNKAFNIFSGKLPRCGKHWDNLIDLVDDLVKNPNTYFKSIENEKKKIYRFPNMPLKTQEFILSSMLVVDEVNIHVAGTPVTPFYDSGVLAPDIRQEDIRRMRRIFKQLRGKLKDQIERASSGREKTCTDIVLSFVKVRHYMLAAAFLLKIYQEQGKTLTKSLPDNILPDALSMELQMSSLLFAYGNFEQYRLLLDRVLLKTETGLILYVQSEDSHYCFLPRIDLEEFLNRYNAPFLITDISTWSFIKRHVSLQVTFLVHEICLLHPLLHFEAYRFLFEDRRNECGVDFEWDCIACLDSIPFLFFMQFLVYKELGLEKQKYEALMRLEVCIDVSSMSDRHIAMNMFGVCCKLEWNYNKAFRFYAKSVIKRPRFNAAIFHIALLVWRFWVKHNLLLFQAGIALNVLNIVD